MDPEPAETSDVAALVAIVEHAAGASRDPFEISTNLRAEAERRAERAANDSPDGEDTAPPAEGDAPIEAEIVAGTALEEDGTPGVDEEADPQTPQTDDQQAHAAWAGVDASVLDLVQAQDIHWLERAFLYDLVIDDSPQHFRCTIEPLEPPPEGHFNFPQSIKETPDECVALWERIVGEVTNHVARARLHDLLFSTRHGDVGHHLAEAAKAYFASVAVVGTQRDDALALCRALALASMMDDQDLLTDILRCMVRLIDDQLGSDEPNASIVLTMLRALTGRSEGSRPEAPDSALLEKAQAAFQRFALLHVREQLAELARRIDAESDVAADLSRAEVQTILDEASRADGLLRVHFLNDAAGRARQYGVSDLEATAVARLQAIDPDSLEWQLVRAEVAVPGAILEEWIRPILAVDTWEEALARFLQTGAPSGSVEANRRSALLVQEQSVLRSLISELRFGGHGLPASTASTPEEKQARAIAEAELSHMNLMGELHVEVLNRMGKRWGVRSSDDIARFLRLHFSADEGLAAAFAESLNLYWEGRYTESLHRAVPKVESGARQLLLFLDEPIYRVEEGKTPGVFPGLGVLLPPLERLGFDPDWSRYLQVLLLNSGANIRNLAAHGFIDHSSAKDTALVLRALGLFTALVPSGAGKSEAGKVLATIPKPVARQIPAPGARLLVVAALAAARLGRRRWTAGVVHQPGSDPT